MREIAQGVALCYYMPPRWGWGDDSGMRWNMSPGRCPVLLYAAPLGLGNMLPRRCPVLLYAAPLGLG